MSRADEAASWLAEHRGIKELRVLGEGQEAVVLTDGQTVYKFFTRWEPKTGDDPPPDELVARIAQGSWRTLYPVEVERRPDGLPLFSYPFEPSTPYSGGRPDELITFLREARTVGFVMSNVHPDNFVVTDGGLRLVDYGVSFHPWSEDGYLHMCRRAWLTLRCFARGDLKELMRAALRDPHLPELEGFDAFLAQARGSAEPWAPATLARRSGLLVPTGQEVTLDPRIVSLVKAARPRNVFDYGCGKGKVTEAIHQEGIAVTGWDPAPTRIARCRGHGSGVRYLDDLRGVLEAGERFDVVVCSIVACIVEEPDVPELLANLRRLLRDDGRVVFSVCHPFYSLTRSSEIHEKEAPPGAHLRSRFEVQAVVRNTGRAVRDLHRPWDWYVRRLAEAGLRVVGIEETEGCSPETGWPHPDYLIAVLAPEPLPLPDVALLIRACAMEAETIDAQVRHLVGQLGGSTPILERIVVVDPRRDGFHRAHGSPNLDLLLTRLEALKAEGVIDDVVGGPEDPAEVRAVLQRWFGLNAAAPYARNGQPVATALVGFERCRARHVVAVDADVMLYRELVFDPVREAIGVLEAQTSAVTASLNIVQAADRPWTRESQTGPWRVEVRAAVYDRERLLAARPLQNYVEDGALALPWHRALDAALPSRGLSSWRGGDRRAGFVHPPNALKSPRAAWLDVVDRVEQGFVPTEQRGHVDLVSVGAEWSGPKRTEPYVFVVCGRNVEPGRLRLCLDSLASQRGPSWGAIVIDDASDDGAAEYLALLCGSMRERVTLIRNKTRRRMLANLHRAVHEFVADPAAVILTLDADDALLGPQVLGRVDREYASGADVTVGSMRRTDKSVRYTVDFTDPRGRRGGNVWQHLRTFKKLLFDRIVEEDLKLDGDWIELANDWAFMVPIVEMAERPVHITDELYLYQPSDDKARREADRTAREAVIARVLAKPRYSRRGGREA
jgi:SAM-dependent methyltransferase